MVVSFSPSETLLLFAGEHFCPLATRVAFHKAAPVELAVTLPNFGVLVGVVTPSAAHHVTPVSTRGGSVAKPSLCAYAPSRSIFLTVIG